MTDSSPLPVRRLPPTRALAIAALAMVALLAGCAAPQPKPEKDQPPSAYIERAEELAESGRPLAAVRIYRDRAREVGPAARQHWHLRLVELLFDHGYPELALEWHRKLDAEPVPAELELRKRLVDAQAAIARRQGIRALRLLPLTDPGMPDDLVVRILATRADAYRLTGRPARALLERVDLGSRLTEPDATERNNEEIWAILQTVPVDRLEQLSEAERVPVMRGWAELALAVRRARLGQTQVRTALEDWRRRYGDHPAAPRFVEGLRERVVAEFTYPEQIALLLPLSGRLSGPAEAIRDGLLAAYYTQPDHIRRPDIVVYDTGEDGISVSRAYGRAVADGAAFVIGPLAKESVAELARRPSLEVPVLSLNYLIDDDVQPSGDFYQFGLLPEDEARQAAEAAIQNSHFNAVALVPAGEWGGRVLEAFRERLDELGGVLLESARYDPSATDYGAAIQSLLDLNESYARERLVESTIGQSTRFDPRRREDLEVIFVAAMPRQARLIKPQLDFHRAGDVPTYMTSHAFTGTPDPNADRDMNGIFFTETPWVLDNLYAPEALYRHIVEHWPDTHDSYPRLYALGIDAFTILPHLDRMDSDPANGLAGRTGRLTLDNRHRVHRQLRWAVLERGEPQPVSHPEAEDELLPEELALERARAERDAANGGE